MIRFNSFQHRLIKLYLPLILIGFGLFFHQTLQKPVAVQAAPATRIVYSGVYTSSGNASAAPVKIAGTSEALAPITCRPDNQFQLAGPFAAPDGRTGLIQQAAPIYHHELYGYTSDQLDSLSRQCPLVVPGDSEPYINAYTSYWIGWQYSYRQASDGLCQVMNPRVLLNIHEALPAWQNSAKAEPSLAGQWQAYTAAVTNHENGHINLIKQSAGQLLTALQSLPAGDCGSIKQTIDSMGAGYVGQLAQANADYDSATQHGALQGAIVP